MAFIVRVNWQPKLVTCKVSHLVEKKSNFSMKDLVIILPVDDDKCYTLFNTSPMMVTQSINSSGGPIRRGRNWAW